MNCAVVFVFRKQVPLPQLQQIICIICHQTQEMSLLLDGQSKSSYAIYGQRADKTQQLSQDTEC